MISRRDLLAGLGAGLALPALAQAPATSLRPLPRPSGRRSVYPDPEVLFVRQGLTGTLAFVVMDAETGTVLEARQPHLALPPASVMKALTALYALDTLGSDYRFATRLRTTGPVTEAGIVQGDLVLEGGGDPVLDIGALTAMATALAGRGIRGITGRLLVDGTSLPRIARIDGAQPAEAGYNPAVSGLNLNFNRVFFHWQRQGNGYETSLSATDGREPRVTMATMRIADRSGPVYAYEDRDGQDHWSVARSALGSAGGRWLPVRQPERYAGEVFRTVAEAAGLRLPAPQPGGNPGATVLVERLSPPAEALIADMLRYSTNLTAEVFGLTASTARGAAPADLAGSAGTMADWLTRTHATGSTRLVDHSGLGDASRISAAGLAGALAHAGWNGPLNRLLKPVALKDDQGKRIAAPAIEAQAKTGTLNFVNTLAGYARTTGGRRLIFAILCADMGRREAVPPDQRDRPPGARTYAVRARRLQHRLLERWAAEYGTRA